jgi:hypothetical protein
VYKTKSFCSRFLLGMTLRAFVTYKLKICYILIFGLFVFAWVCGLTEICWVLLVCLFNYFGLFSDTVNRLDYSSSNYKTINQFEST